MKKCRNFDELKEKIRIKLKELVYNPGTMMKIKIN